ncbi:MAG: response regulator [Clostridiales Family XIII bacterium]|jgi:signal transduction histidine kinase|nr:response regulator [Clostridiales Family XIII bacterium]
MQKPKKFIDRYVFSEDLSLDARMTNMVCMVGIVMVIVAIITRAAMGSSQILLIVLAGIVVCVSALLVFCNVYDKHKIGAWLILFALCDVLLPAALFAMGGVKSGMSSYFTMSVVLIFFLSRGKPRVVILITHILWVILCYTLSAVPPFNALVSDLSGTAQYIDHIQSFMVSGFFIAIIVVFQDRIFVLEKEKSDKLVVSMNAMAVALLDLNVDSPESAMREGMATMARNAGIDCVAVWKNVTRDGASGFTHQISAFFSATEADTYLSSNEDELGFTYEDTLPGWWETLSSDRSIKLTSSAYSPKERAFIDILDADIRMHILSLLVIPIIAHGHFWGTVVFNNCHDGRAFSEDDERNLRPWAILLANAMIRNEMMRDLARAQDEAESASRAKSDFLSNMSHEMRTPMNAIIGMTTIGKAAADLEKKDYAFEKIENAGAHLLGVINDILDRSKIEATTLELSLSEFDFGRMLRTAVNVNSFRIEEKRQHFTMRVDEGIPDRLIGDEQRLTQVITNLLSNATKFTPEDGEIRLEARLEGTEDDVCTIRFDVTDTGIGISEEQQERLFTSFQQAESSTSRMFGGTGLGLAISRRLVDMMGGRIWIDSAPDRGSTFSFTMRAARGAAEERRPAQMSETDRRTEAAGARDGPDDFAGRRILLAEDIDINREIVISLLEPTGIAIDCAENGAEAVRLFEEAPDRYDMVFMDVQMPKMDGYEATRRIRALDIPRAKEIPIVAMTANVFREDIESALDSGMTGHLGKPLDAGKLMEKLREYLG